MPRSNFSIVRRVASKEVTLFFASPVAYLFLAAFAAVTLFVFFWGESFFSRNIADVRPMFEWMPLLLIFLCSTLTMRLWSEERRTGTLEHILTQPVPLWAFVVGKFFGCLVLLLIALLITLPLPITVSMIGDIDWGPVWAGYIAAFCLGAAYLAIGLFVSSRSNNQIVSLIASVALCGVFYLIGSDGFTSFFGNASGEWLRLLGTGSRFDSITRGVIDLRDLYYYLSIVLVFLALNTYFLEKERWTNAGRTKWHKGWQAVTALLVLNAIAANLWLGQLNKLRVDATEGKQYSISGATHNFLGQLQEPLLIRGYFSGKTHPLLAPLVPQIRDLIREYEIAGDGQVQVEFIDPLQNPALEEEANQQYGIEPVPFQVADRYQSSIVSSYFNVLVKYGDETQVLGFPDLIDVKQSGEANLDVRLRNPELDLTKAIKKVLTTYQAGGNLFDTVNGELTFNAYLSNDAVLPADLVAFREMVQQTVAGYEQQSDGRLKVNFIDPDAEGGAVAQLLAEEYGLRPMRAGLFGGQPFWYYMLLEKGDQAVQIPLDNLTDTGFDRNFKAAIKRFATGFTKTVAMVLPAGQPNPYGGPPRSDYAQLEAFLGGDLNTIPEDLSDGAVDGLADILLVIAPENLDEKAVFAIDQFLMKGGTVVTATSPRSATFGRQRIDVAKKASGIEDWLAHNGVSIADNFVMDPQNAAFPAPVNRQVGGMQLQEIRMLNYPYFLDVRADGLNADNPITSSLPQLNIAWASPLTIDEAKNSERTVTELIKSTAGSWVSDSIDIMPRLQDGAVAAYQPEGETGSQLVAAIVGGQFDSYFAGQDSPMLESAENPLDAAASVANGEQPAEESEEEEKTVVSGVIDRSPASSRIIVFASNDFLRDQMIQLAGSANGSAYMTSYEMMANTIDWSLEDTGLLQIRSRGHFNRTLPPMARGQQLFWEYLNYALAAIALALIALVYRRMRAGKQRRHSQIMSA
jgi:ABC-2 type transport system permease protein